MRPVATTRSASGMTTGRLAVWWVIGSEIVIFGGVLGSYIMHRLANEGWAKVGFAGSTNEWIGLTNTFVLLTSSLFAVLAHYAAEHEQDGKKAAKLLYATTAMGGLFLCIKAFEWTTEINHGLTITANNFWSFYYVAAGIHASHVIAGMIIMLFVAQTAKRNEELHRVELIGVYWHFVDLVWIFLFPLLYIAK